MKFCLKSRQTSEYLEKADEIKVYFRDRKSLTDLILKYPEKTFILVHHIDEGEINWEDIRKWNLLTKGNFILCSYNPTDIIKAIEMDIQTYFGLSVNDYETLDTLAKMGVKYVRVGGSLFFDMENVSKKGMKIRVVPNVAFFDGLPREDGVVGTWIRPEDLDLLYEKYVDAVEFEFCNLIQEQTLFKIYAENKNWPGDLGRLVQNLNYVGKNRLIVDLSKRLRCRQICKSGGACNLCYTALEVSDMLINYNQD